MTLIDTHCHVHFADYPLDIKEVDAASKAAGVEQAICVGSDAANSRLAVDFAQSHPGYWASIGIHPNDQIVTPAVIEELRALAVQPKVVAVGECGLDYFYEHQPRRAQQAGLRAQMELALEYDLPLIFHVRDAFDDFWPIYDEYAGQQTAAGHKLRGVLHSFTDTPANADKGLARGLLIGVNGIVTFTKKEWQLALFRSLPLESIVLETDSPFLTPAPHRGKVNMPARVGNVAEFLAGLKAVSPLEVATKTTHNARQLFNFYPN